MPTLIDGLKPTSRKWPKILRNAIRAHRFYQYGWRAFAIHYRGAVEFKHWRRANFAVNRSNRVYNFTVNRHKTGKLFDSSGV